MVKFAALLLTTIATLLSAQSAVATPVATSDGEYAVLGRVFPDPLAGCQQAGSEPCSPNAQGNVAATQFIQWQEFLDAMQYMNQRPEWQRHVEVWALDGKLGAGAGSGLGADAVPGNNLGTLEFEPRDTAQSAGIPETGPGTSREKSDLIVVRVTDETVPDAGKKRYALSLSIHGIERAGVEGGTRAVEDLVTAFTTGVDDEPVVPRTVDPDSPTFAEVLRKTIIYFTYPNPDGWRRGSVSEGGFFYQRYNGNGVDLNRDWPDIGFAFRPYSGLSEPETRAFARFFDDVKGRTGSEFAAGDDLHGQPEADALSFTLLPHGSHDFAKDLRIRDTAIAIHQASEEALLWSPIVQPNDAPQGGGPPCVPGALGSACAQIYGQTWGTVYDTINYTTTGALGDYFDSSVGLGADGIDNEMSFSHLDKNVAFDPHTEQLHVDGNKALIYAHLGTILSPRTGTFDPAGTNGYVPNTRVKREEKVFQPAPPPGTQAQTDINGQLGTPSPDGTVFPFTVERDADTFNGGMRVDITTTNAQGVGTGITSLKVQCRGCDEHPGVTDDSEWVTVAEDYNQSPIYAQAGITAAVNRPDPFRPDGSPVEWRALIDSPAPATMSIDFTSGPASTEGETGGGDPPKLHAYDVANTDFFEELNPHIADPAERFQQIDPRAVIEGRQSLAGIGSLVLADDPLPGYTGDYGDAAAPAPTGPPTDDIPIQGSGTTVPGASSGAPGTFDEVEFDIAPDDGNGSMRVRIDWSDQVNDYDMFLYLEEENGDRTEVGRSTGTQGTTNFEQIDVANPAAGHYVLRVDNFAANPADNWSGAITFEPPPAGEEPTGTGAFTTAEKDSWFDALGAWVEAGGNLVLTDGALRALPELTALGSASIERQTVYAGQMSFAETAGDDTTDEPLAENVRQPGSRFNGGDEQKRRQTFEPTPLGFAIQNPATGSDESHARQFHVGKEAFEDAGGDVVATSADAGDRDAAADFENVTLGEFTRGQGRIRIAGALLPQPTTEFDHTFGLEPFAVTYTGYIVFCNLVDCEVRAASQPGGPGGGGTAAQGAAIGPTQAFGDFDGDGKLDLAIGSPGENRARGTVTVIPGGERGLDASRSRLFTQKVRGIGGSSERGDRFGAALAAGDVNGDGRDDLAVGTPGERVRRRRGAGAVNLLFGSPGGLRGPGSGFVHQSRAFVPGVSERGDGLGAGVLLEDLNGDRRADLVAGSPGEDTGRRTRDAGAATVVYGASNGLTRRGARSLSQAGRATPGSPRRGDRFGLAFSAGDFDGDGFGDLVVGAPGEDLRGAPSAGAVTLYTGSAGGVSGARGQVLHQNSRGVPDRAERGDGLGSALAAADLDGDGRADLVASAPGEGVARRASAGAVTVLFGGAESGLTTAGARFLHQGTPGVLDRPERGDALGATLAVGDLNGDDRADLVVGVPGERVRRGRRAGAANVLFGSVSGLTAAGDQFWHQARPGVADGPERGDTLAGSLGIGDTTGDGRGDLTLGVPGEDLRRARDAGAVHLLPGSAGGVTANASRFVTQNTRGIASRAERRDRFGGG